MMAFVYIQRIPTAGALFPSAKLYPIAKHKHDRLVSKPQRIRLRRVLLYVAIGQSVYESRVKVRECYSYTCLFQETEAIVNEQAY